ncbi:tetraacyldisaccharide 4'-kinase [Legionella waltersii]|uniref:Tetraacyldisaccharide 4'-kinase n=1 Tax=Legionella waltersii TaxID=66969 RepID=A0A0W1AAI0_9GAMM|nr:tetraacyldisaccharide 4'-kinase [Legionella waltersii]KTD78349.1 tetraacyldisaccharide 4'-kinase [Legionella waltersii]SNV06523.1 tetraacyldisaccharide 4'-kinase [Legionella waltersii]
MSFLIEKIWYGNSRIKWFLWPFSLIYKGIITIRRQYLEQFKQCNFAIPIIVVGNITVGGVGKTPLVIELARRMLDRGLKVGIVSRGYGAQMKHFPHEVKRFDSADQVGDEPLLIAKKVNCPVVIDPDRVAAVQYLMDHHSVQLVISDDGLQHYRMGRTIELALIDGLRGLGNRLCLPAGPLRESDSRLNEVDFVIVNEGEWKNAYSMKLSPGKIINLSTQEELSVEQLSKEVAAVAAIGNPQRFYSTLSKMGIKFNAYSYPDHYQFTSYDLNYRESLVIMTEKDAVKCQSFNLDKLCVLPVEARLSDDFWDALWSHQLLKGYC